jgi:hypothetical protein
LRESSQAIKGNGELVGNIEICEFQWETGDLGEKRIEVMVVEGKVVRGEIGEPL